MNFMRFEVPSLKELCLNVIFVAITSNEQPHVYLNTILEFLSFELKDELEIVKELLPPIEIAQKRDDMIKRSNEFGMTMVRNYLKKESLV